MAVTRAAPLLENSDAEAVEASLPELGAVYREHHGFVWRNARRLVADPSLVDDVVHEVFLVVARRLHEFRNEAQIRSWLFAITYHVVQRFRRDRARYNRRLDEYGQCFESDGKDTTSDEASYHLRQLLSKLSESQRLIFIMSELEGMTSVEIGHCLGLKTGTVDSRLRAARRQLRSLLERELARMRRFLP